MQVLFGSAVFTSQDLQLCPEQLPYAPQAVDPVARHWFGAITAMHLLSVQTAARAMLSERPNITNPTPMPIPIE